ncbi:MAG: deoxyribonuclease IV [Clostridia bacterium]|nr:deoxyribonuclease IV [Clostridia bacterium]
MFYIGCHLSVTGGYAEMGRRALSIGATTFQFFTKNPRGRSSGSFPSEEDVAELNRMIRENGMHAPLAHAPYIYNPCSKDEKIREYTAEAMGEELRFLESIPGAMYNFHPGCHVGQGVNAGIGYISDMLSRIMWSGMGTRVLLETMAGKGTELGRSFEEIAEIIDGVDASVRDKVGVCLDTCHVHDGGYVIAEDPCAVLDEFDRVIGLERLWAVHMNDSANVMGARKDRHARIGEGHIPVSAMETLICHPTLKKVPFYLETPCDLDGYAEEIALLKRLRGEA